jgi:hypothetical protein
MPRRPRPWRRPATTPAHCACGNFSLFVVNGQNLTKFYLDNVCPTHIVHVIGPMHGRCVSYADCKDASRKDRVLGKVAVHQRGARKPSLAKRVWQARQQRDERPAQPEIGQ